MRLRTFFFLAFATACLPAIGWSAWIAAGAWAAWTQAGAAVRAAEAMGDALQLVEALSIERGALQEAALSPGHGVENLAVIRARNDALLTRTEQSLGAAGLPQDAVTEARDILTASRRRVAEETARPLAERNPEVAAAVVTQLYQRLDAVQAAVALAEGRAAQAYASVGALLAVASLDVDIRDAAGRRSSLLSGWLGGRTLTPGDIEQATQLTGRLMESWERLQRQVHSAGASPRLAEAVKVTRTSFFEAAEPRYRQFVEIARDGGQRPMPLPEWRRWTIAALRKVLAARDAAVADAVDRGQALAAAARNSLLAAGMAALGLLVLAAIAVAALLRRLVLPVQRLTAATTALAAGDTTAPAPGRSGLAEVDAMARAVEVFRAGALRLRESEARYRLLAENAADMIVQHTADRRRTYVSPASRTLLGHEPEDMLQRDFAEMLHPDDREGVVAAYNHLMRKGGRITCSYRLRHKDGHYVWVEAHWVATLTEVPGAMLGAVHGMELVAVVRDVSERKEAEARIAHMAHHDALTALPNRVLLRERLQEALARAGRGEVFAVLCLDLDHFKAVNDTLGHTVGDALLRIVTQRLLAHVRETDTVARLGGDEFAVVQSSVNQPHDATALARRVIEVLGEPFEIDGHQVVVGASVGIAIAPSDGADPDQLLKNADLALYRAKADGRAAWRFFEPEMDARMQERRLLELDLRRALVAGEFELHYQPLINPRTRRAVGFEALIRWRHPERGLVSPAEFVPLAEEIGLIGAIGEWVLQRACAEAASWPGQIKVAVNLSAAQLRAGRALADTVAAALKASGLPAHRLELEVTETAMLQDTDEVLATLHQIRDMGVAIAMDDFGTGYSSLTYLRRFPFERVKIDKSFVQELAREKSEGGAIVHAVADLCASLGIATTAEGVETEEQLQQLLAEGLTEVQGYLFSRPVPATGVPEILEAADRLAVAGDEIRVA